MVIGKPFINDYVLSSAPASHLHIPAFKLQRSTVMVESDFMLTQELINKSGFESTKSSHSRASHLQFVLLPCLQRNLGGQRMCDMHTLVSVLFI